MNPVWFHAYTLTFLMVMSFYAGRKWRLMIGYDQGIENASFKIGLLMMNVSPHISMSTGLSICRAIEKYSLETDCKLASVATLRQILDIS